MSSKGTQNAFSDLRIQSWIFLKKRTLSSVETREKSTGHGNPRFLQQRRTRDRRTARWLSLSVILRIKSARIFQLFLASRGVNEEDCPLLSKLYCETLRNTSSLHFTIILNSTIACSHTLFQEHDYSQDQNVCPQANSVYCSVVATEKAGITDFENSYKIIENNYNDNFFVVVIKKMRIFI